MRMAPSSSSRKITDMTHCFKEQTIRLAFSSRVVFLWMALLSIPLHSQQLYFDQFTASDGLAQSTVYNIIQDKNDIYWMGTLEGLSSFDGVKFTNYSADQGLAENGVLSICEDRHGILWFGHIGGGVSRYNGSVFEVLTNGVEFMDSDVTSIIEDSAGHLWFTTYGSGVIKLLNPQAEKDKIDLQQYSGRDLSDRVSGSHIDKDGRIYFITDINVKYYNSDSARFDNLVLNGVPQYYNKTCIQVDRRGRTWFGTHNGGLYRYDPHQDNAKMYDLVKAGLKSNWVSTLFEDNKGNIWVGTWEGGIARIDTDNRITLFSHTNGLPGTKIRCIIQDREGHILIGTHDNGLCVYKGDHFISYFKEDGLINSQVWAVLQTDNGDIWFGTNEGISILTHTAAGESLYDFSRLKGERIGYLKEDSHGTVWIGTTNTGVSSFDRAGNHVLNQRINVSLSQSQVTAMDIDGEDNLWVGSLDGLFYYEIGNRTITRLSQENGLKGNSISVVFVDSRERIWVGAEGRGITMINGSDFIQLDIGFDFTPRSFAEDVEGKIWIGTEGKGLLQFDPDSMSIIRSFTVDDGLLANVINQLSCDKSNNIYIGTNKGLNIIYEK